MKMSEFPDEYTPQWMVDTFRLWVLKTRKWILRHGIVIMILWFILSIIISYHILRFTIYDVHPYKEALGINR